MLYGAGISALWSLSIGMMRRASPPSTTELPIFLYHDEKELACLDTIQVAGIDPAESLAFPGSLISVTSYHKLPANPHLCHHPFLIMY